MEQLEIWKDIPGYEGMYQASTKGRVKSFYNNKENLKKPTLLKTGYLGTTLKKNGKQKHFRFHQLVVMAFMNHRPDGMKIIVDHINHDKTDNRLENLRLVNNRQNSLSRKKNRDLPHGVLFQSSKSKPYFSQIWKNGKSHYLGSFTTAQEASQAYEQELNKLK